MSKYNKIVTYTEVIGKDRYEKNIQLPFGFVQWHQSQIQFHHKFNKIKNIYENK